MEDYVTYEQAVKLKECGFKWETMSVYFDCPNAPTLTYGITYQIWSLEQDEILASTLSQAAKWLREEYNLYILIETVIGKKWTYTLVDTDPQSDMYGEFQDRIPDRNGYPVFDTYEVALSAGIDAALELIKEERNGNKRNKDNPS